MNVNHDVLELIASYLEVPDLLQLCCASRCLRNAAIPILYTDVCVDTLQKLEAFASTIKRTPAIARRVRTFTEEVSAYRPFYAGVTPAQWCQYLTALMTVLNGLPTLARVALSVSFDGCGDAHALAYRIELANGIAALSGLQMLAVCDLDYESLDLLDICPPLKALHLSASHTEWTGSVGNHDRFAWVKKLLPILDARHSATLVELDIPYASALHKPKFAHVRMPNVLTLVTAEGVRPSRALATIFPALRHLRLNNQPVAEGDDALDKLWPDLAHVELEAWRPGILNPGHRVRSLALFLDGPDSVKDVASLASPYVEALRLRWEDAPPQLQPVLSCFPNLKYLNVPFTLESLHRFHAKMREGHSTYFHRIEFAELTVVVMPPPPTEWEPDLPLAGLRERSSNFRAASVHWIDADFVPKTRAWAACADGFDAISPKEAARMAAEYKFTMLWPRRPAFGPESG